MAWASNVKVPRVPCQCEMRIEDKISTEDKKSENVKFHQPLYYSFYSNKIVLLFSFRGR